MSVRAAGNGRDQGQLVALPQFGAVPCVLVVDRRHHAEAIDYPAQLLDGVMNPRAVGKLELELSGARALTERREQSHAHLHGAKASPRRRGAAARPVARHSTNT